MARRSSPTLPLERYLSTQETALLCALSGAFAVQAWYGAFDLEQPLDNSAAAVIMLGVLQVDLVAGQSG